MRPLAAIAASALLAAGCKGGAIESGYPVTYMGNADVGETLIEDFDCGSCHSIPGVDGANGLVAPPLTYFARRTFIAGQLPNKPENLVRWLLDPPAVEPGTAMPDLGLTNAQARHITAYLYTLR